MRGNNNYSDMQKMVSVIVTTYNRPKILEENIKALSIQRIDGFLLEIIVVDDSSSFENSKIVRNTLSQYPLVTYVRNEKNIGLSGSRNVGAAIAKGEFLIFLDDDIIVEYDYVLGHVSKLNNETGIATVGSLRFPPELTKNNNLMKYLSSRELRQRSFNEILLCDLDPQYFGGGICGIRTSDFRFVKGFDETFQFYGNEDVEMGYQLKKSGVRIVYASDARADHFDTVYIDRYRNKYIESGREGIKLLLRHDRDFFKNSPMRYILPIGTEDSRKVKVIKFFIHLVLGTFTERVLRNLAKFTNQYSRFYSKYLYHALFACWMLQGVKDKGFRDKSQVEYNENLAHNL